MIATITIEPTSLFEPKMSAISHAPAATIPAAGMVRIQADTICPNTFQCTGCFLPIPAPVTPPETTWVVDSG